MISLQVQRIKYVLADYVSANVAFFLFNICRFFILDEGWDSLSGYLFSEKLIWEQIIIPPVLLMVYWFSGFYNKPIQRSRISELITTFTSSVLVTALIYLALLVNEAAIRRAIHYEVVLVLFGMFFIITYLGRFLITTYTFAMIRRRRWRFNTIIVGNSTRARQVANSIARSQSLFGYQTIGFVEIPDEKNVKDSHRLFSFDELQTVIAENNVMQLIIVPEINEEQRILELLRVLMPLNVTIKIAANTFSYLTSSLRIQDVYGEPLMEVSAPAIEESSKNIKRLIDIVGSFITLVILAIPMSLVGLAVKLNSSGPMFYSQERRGYRGKKFRIYKFRTMISDAEKDGPQLSTPGDVRITSVGRWLRKYRIDELPQFYNVLKGDMSLVGPRPERDFYIRQITEQAPYYTLLQQVRPGITSWGMVKFGYASTVEQMVERTRFDLLYIANMSLTMDLKIMVYTVKTIFSGKGM